MKTIAEITNSSNEKQQLHEKLCDQFGDLVAEHVEGKSLCKVSMKWIKSCRKNELIMLHLFIHLCKMLDAIPRVMLRDMTTNTTDDCPMKTLLKQFELLEHPVEGTGYKEDESASTSVNLDPVTSN